MLRLFDQRDLLRDRKQQLSASKTLELQNESGLVSEAELASSRGGMTIKQLASQRIDK
jgi:hypothetical protein